MQGFEIVISHRSTVISKYKTAIQKYNLCTLSNLVKEKIKER